MPVLPRTNPAVGGNRRAVHDRGQAGSDLAREAERRRTQWTPFRALAGVWVFVAVTVAAVIALTVVAVIIWT
jgi:hypothetical protein